MASCGRSFVGLAVVIELGDARSGLMFRLLMLGRGGALLFLGQEDHLLLDCRVVRLGGH